MTEEQLGRLERFEDSFEGQEDRMLRKFREVRELYFSGQKYWEHDHEMALTMFHVLQDFSDMNQIDFVTYIEKKLGFSIESHMWILGKRASVS